MVNTMTFDALGPKVAIESADNVLAVLERQHVLLFQSQFHLHESSQIKNTIQNMNISFIILKKK